MICSGTSPDGSLVEIVEIPSHPFFLLQDNFTQNLNQDQTVLHPLFKELVRAD